MFLRLKTRQRRDVPEFKLQRRDVTEKLDFQHHDVADRCYFNVATLQRGLFSTSRL